MNKRYLIQARVRGQPLECGPFLVGPPQYQYQQALDDAKRLSPDWVNVFVLTQDVYWQQVIKREKIRD